MRTAGARGSGIAVALLFCATGPIAAWSDTRPISELKPTAVIRLGKTADWVAIDDTGVWVGSTGPFAVNRIDPQTNTLRATVELDGEPCAGLAHGFGSIWIPLCGERPGLARADSARNVVTAVYSTGPIEAEGGITASPDSLWLVTGKRGTLIRIDPRTGKIRQRVRIPAGSFNPRYYEGRVWISRAEGAEVTVVDASSGRVRASVKTGPGPRFLTDGAGSVWTLNQGDGTMTRIDAQSMRVAATIALGTPGHGGDIAFGGGMIWTTLAKTPLSAVDAASSRLLCQWVGDGGDSLGISHDALWLTDYHGGTVSRLELRDTVDRCAHGDER